MTRSGDADTGNVATGPHPLPVHVRTIRIDAAKVVAEGETERAALRIHGSLEDRRPQGVPDWIQHDGDVIHHMEVTLTVTWPDLAVSAINGEMRTFPHAGVCPDALPPLQGLVGITVGRGFTRRSPRAAVVRELLPGVARGRTAPPRLARRGDAPPGVTQPPARRDAPGSPPRERGKPNSGVRPWSLTFAHRAGSGAGGRTPETKRRALTPEFGFRAGKFLICEAGRALRVTCGRPS